MAALSASFTLISMPWALAWSRQGPASKAAPQAPTSGAAALSGSAVGAYSCATREIGSPHARFMVIRRPKFEAGSGFEPVMPKNRCTGGINK